MKTFSEVKAQFPQDVQDRYDFSNAEYTGALERIKNVICPEHGVFSQYAAQFRKGRGCPECGANARTKSRRTPAEDYIDKVTEVHGGKYDYSNIGFVRMNAPITVICPEHGKFTISANHHYYRKQGCGKCETEAKRVRIVQYRHLSADAKITNTAKGFFDRCMAVHDHKYTYPEQEYKGAKQKLVAICPVHGEFEQAAWAHLSGKGCAKCGAADPKWERDIYAITTGLGFEVVRSAPVLDGKHIDLYIPDRKIGIELHGLRWHTANKRGVSYHRDKWVSANAHGIRLIQVFEDEWAEKSHIVQNRIEAVLGICSKYAARKCQVESLSATEGRAFLEAHHLQGSGNASAYYGLYKDGVLLAVASFCPSRSGAMTGAKKEGEWEVLRYASIGRVQGGFSRLFKQFLRDTNPSKVISYCDLRYGDGRLYEAAGFMLDSITEPDYWWVPAGKVQRVPRYVTQKHKLKTHPILAQYFSETKTEAQICAEAGWEKIFGVGHQKWIWMKTVDKPNT